MLLASKDTIVEVLEKQPYTGGRTSPLHIGGYTFDRGPTFLNMPHILEELFAKAGRSVDNYVRLVPIEPFYRLRFEDAPFYVYKGRGQMIQEIGRKFPGNESGYERFMRMEKQKFKALLPILQTKHDLLLDYVRQAAGRVYRKES